MRIAILLAGFPRVSETFILHQITGLVARGHEVDIYANSAGDPGTVHGDVARWGLLERTRYRPGYPDRGLRRAIKGLLFAARTWRSPGAVGRALFAEDCKPGDGITGRLATLLPFVGRGSYDVIHCHYGVNGLRGLFLRETGVAHGRMATTFYGHDVNGFSPSEGRRVYARLFASGELFVAFSSFLAGKLTALGCPPERIIRIPLGLDVRRFAFREVRPQPGKPIRLITVGRLSAEKGIAYAIAAMVEILREHPNVVYEIVGDGPLRAELEQQIVTLGLGDHVHLLGWKTQEELRGLYANAHIFVLPSVRTAIHEETQGLVLQEAQAMGLPIVASRIGGIPEGILDSVSGFLVPERDSAALAERLSYLITHAEQWPAMGRAGRSFVEKHFDIENLNDQLVAAYERLLDNASQERCATAL